MIEHRFRRGCPGVQMRGDRGQPTVRATAVLADATGGVDGVRRTVVNTRRPVGRTGTPASGPSDCRPTPARPHTGVAGIPVLDDAEPRVLLASRTGARVLGVRQTHTELVIKEKIFAHWWSRAVLFGAPPCAVFALVGPGGGVVDRVGRAIVGGVVFGLLMAKAMEGPYQTQQLRIASLTAGLAPEGRALAQRASVGGAVPDDPQIRAAAAAVVRYRLDLLTAHWRGNVIGMSAFELVFVVLALFSSPGWWLAAAFVAYPLLGQGIWLRSRRRRLILLDV